MLLRFYSDSRGHLKLDPAQVAPGRGAYVCPVDRCVTKAVHSGSFARSLRRNIAKVTAEALIERSQAELGAYSQCLKRAALEDGRVFVTATDEWTPEHRG